MKKAAKKKRTSGRATKVRKAIARKPARSKGRTPARRPAARTASRASSPPSKRGRGPNSEAADLARSALEAFDAGYLDKARRDIMALSEMLSNG
jgi:hypothetical protein